jgi:hypothetical protein
VRQRRACDFSQARSLFILSIFTFEKREISSYNTSIAWPCQRLAGAAAVLFWGGLLYETNQSRLHLPDAAFYAQGRC